LAAGGKSIYFFVVALASHLRLNFWRLYGFFIDRDMAGLLDSYEFFRQLVISRDRAK
jgi:hypothetical protein